MQIDKTTPDHTRNKCKHCSVAEICLPAKLKKSSSKLINRLDLKARILKPGEHLFRQGDLINCLYAIRSGILKSYTTLEDGREYIMGFHLPPDLFGWEAIDQNQLSVSVIALDYSNICEIPLEQLEQLTREIPEITTQLLQMVSQRIRNDNVALLRASAEQRVAKFILELNSHYTALGFPYYLCKLTMTHQDIANYLRIAPETISRTFHNLQEKGIIGISRKDIYLNDMNQLKKIAQE